jgi:hypothetical protein
MIVFCKSLRSSNYKGLEVSSKVFDVETHISVIAAQVSRTITSLYGVKKNKKQHRKHSIGQIGCSEIHLNYNYYQKTPNCWCGF